MSSDLHHLGGAYALDALSADERRAFEAHFPTCAVCAAEVAEFRATAAELAAGVAVDPPDHVRDRVLAEVATTRQVGPLLGASVVDLAARRRQRASLAIGAVAAAIVAVVAFVVGAATRPDQVRIEDVASAGDAVTTRLEGADGAVTVIWSPGQDRVAVVGTDVADPGPRRAYELWFLTSDGATPAGLFSPVNGTVSAVFDVEDLDPGAWGVTNEPDTGSPQPTGEVLYTAEV